jgi:hypothetical protein
MAFKFNPITGNLDYYEPAGVGGGQVNSVLAGDDIDVDSTDPANPIVSYIGDNYANIDGGDSDAVFGGIEFNLDGGTS